MRPFYTIQESDVGKRFLKMFGRTWPLVNLCGHILAVDVGKRIYLVGNDLGMENKQQFEARKLCEGAK